MIDEKLLIEYMKNMHPSCKECGVWSSDRSCDCDDRQTSLEEFECN